MPRQHKIVIKKRHISIHTTFDFFKLIYQFKQNEKWKKKEQKNKIKTQNSHEFRSSFILNMNKKEYKRREFNHNNTNPENIYIYIYILTRNFSRIFLYLEPKTNYQQKH